MELLGNWTGVCYYENTRPFVLDNTMKLSIIISDEKGNMRATVTEICELHGLQRDGEEEDTIQENVFHLAGKYNEEKKTLKFAGECEQKGRRMRSCVLNLKLIEEEEKLEGVFEDPERSGDSQSVELHKGDVRRDLQELQEMGRLFLEKIREMEGR